MLHYRSFLAQSNISILATRIQIPTDYIHVHLDTSGEEVRTYDFYPAEACTPLIRSR